MTRNLTPWKRDRPSHPALSGLHDERTLGERVADRIASFGGSWPFIFLFLGIIFGWMVLNTLLLARVLNQKPFDPFPYIALNLVLSAMAGLQAPVIMMSQNRAAARDEALADHHYAETKAMETLIDTVKQLLDVNTDLTKQVHALTEEVHRAVVSK